MSDGSETLLTVRLSDGVNAVCGKTGAGKSTLLEAIGFAVFGAHALIVAAAPMDLGTRKAASSATGFIDGWGYVGAGLQGFATGMLVDRWGWNAGFMFWIACALAGTAVMAFLWKHKPAQKREYL